jgi:sialate O-acetylesterase
VPDKELWQKRMETPTILFDRMLAPLVPFGIKGAIWYQGESGAGLDLPYGKLFQIMIQDWRKQWQLGDFPFYFVQVGNWATCEGQASALQLPNTGMAVINDISDTIHPPKKVAIGQRLARLALVQTYGRKVESTGPLFESAKVQGSSIRIRFTHAGDGLVIRDGPPMKYFTIAGDDKRFLVADVRIDGDTVVVSNPQVPQPLAVRYAWTGSSYLNFKEAILLNKAGLPAAPFRTDDWPLEEKGTVHEVAGSDRSAAGESEK